MERIVVFGGHGKVAQRAERILAARGDEVTAVIRYPAQAPEIAATGAIPQVADVEDLTERAMTGLITQHDAVVWAAGAGGGSPAKTKSVDHDAAIRSIDAAVAAGVKRYVMVSYFGASADHGVDPDNPFFAYAEAKGTVDEYLRASGLEWTVLGPSSLTLDEPTGRIDTAAAAGGSVSRGNVAQVIAAVLADSSTIGRTIAFNDGDTPIPDALAQAIAQA